MIARFQARAKAVRQRGIPPLEGPERKRFVDQARIDFQDYAIIGDAEGAHRGRHPDPHGGPATQRVTPRPDRAPPWWQAAV